MNEEDAKRYFFILKLGLNYDKIKEAMNRIQEEAVKFLGE
jgi:hypothetical protein